MSPLLPQLAFSQPLLLWALALLPLIWWLIRLTPPAPRRQIFPALALLRGLLRREETPAKTPWWLLLLRCLVAALIILALAGPRLNPAENLPGEGAVLLVIDDGWSAAHSWKQTTSTALALTRRAEQQNRHIILLTTAPGADGSAPTLSAPLPPAEARARLLSLYPKPWHSDRAAAAAALAKLPNRGATHMIWLSDGLQDSGTGAKSIATPLVNLIKDGGRPLVFIPPENKLPLRLTSIDNTPKGLELRIARPTLAPRPFFIRAIGKDGALLVRQAGQFATDSLYQNITIALPDAMRPNIQRVEIESESHLGAQIWLDERWKIHSIGIASTSNAANGRDLLTESFYLQRAFEPNGIIWRDTITSLIPRQPSLLILGDIAAFNQREHDDITKYVQNGGVLLRFAGSRLAESASRMPTPQSSATDSLNTSLLPSPLRGGERVIGGTLGWEKPAQLADFPNDSPFARLVIPPDVQIRRQVLTLADPTVKIWASLSDGTPLVTARKEGRGWIVLVHTTANAEWSDLPLSGLFVDMLHRLAALGNGAAAPGDSTATLTPQLVFDAFGQSSTAPTRIRPIPVTRLETAPDYDAPAGIWSQNGTRIAFNLASHLSAVTPLDLPVTLSSTRYQNGLERDLEPWLLLIGLILFSLDTLLALYLRGLLRWSRTSVMTTTTSLLLILVLFSPARADTDDLEIARRNTENLTLGYISSGDASIDATAKAGLEGLATVLNRRTTVQNVQVQLVDPATDSLAFYPFLYWPVSESSPDIPDTGLRALNLYMASGGTIVFDTRDQLYGSTATQGPGSAALQRISSGLDIGQLVPIPDGHVMTKAFYLLKDFPGRVTGGQTWVEASDAERNDGVSSVIITANDWAGAWASRADGRPMYPVVPGGDRQREMALRTGVNLTLYTLTGNYKSDQVHVPFILERIGQ